MTILYGVLILMALPLVWVCVAIMALNHKIKKGEFGDIDD
jgi:hypothetical protein